MKVTDILASGKRTLSFEVFPPKTSERFESVREAVGEVAALSPDYMSVTYGAGGSGSRFTLPIAAEIGRRFGVPVIHHLTCVGSTAGNVAERLGYMKSEGIDNVLALRGDIPEGDSPDNWAFRHANELASFIRSHGDFCIGGACYPETHPESASPEADLRYLRLKVECGCCFLTTQLFLDNSVYYAFLDRLASAGIGVPVTAGIMPVTSVRLFNRIVTLSGSAVPAPLARKAAVYADDPDGMRLAGIEFAIGQIRDLYDRGVRNVHLYTMNSASVAAAIKSALSEYLA